MRTLQRLLLALFLGFGGFSSYAQVTGYALLDGQSDHSGIKIKFYPNSPSAVLDSTTSGVNGDYSVSLSPGIYNMSFNKSGYQDAFYDNGNPVFISGNETLDSITLYTGVFQNISGNVSGTFYDSIIYIINGDLNIQDGYSLTVEPGTQIKFNGNHNINVYGELILIGTPSSPILISSNKTNPQPNDWGFIEYHDGSSPNPQISYCIIEYGRIYSTLNDITITHNIIRNFVGRGIEERHSSSYIAHNEIYNFYDDIWTGIGIMTQFSNTIVECNHVYNGTGRGISLWSGNQVAQNNLVHDINLNSSAHMGIELGGPDSEAIAKNNIVYNCKIGIAIDDWYDDLSKPNPTIINNTLFDNQIGIDFTNTGQYGTGVIKMNFLYNNGIGIQGAIYNQPTEISYNLIWGGSNDFSGISILGLGQIITTNANGDSSDAYYNIFIDPLVDSLDIPNVQANSPILDAGDSITKDIGIDATIFGCIDLSVGLNTIRTAEIAVDIYPNPTSSTLLIDTHQHLSDIKILDISGKVIKSIPPNSNEVNVADLSNGIYFLKIIVDKRPIIKKFIKH